MTEPRKRSRLPIVLGSIAVALTVLILVGLAVLDRVATTEAQKQAAAWSTKLGRKIEVGSISTTFFTGLGVKVSAISVGPGQGEAETLLSLARVEVKIAALQALFSLGKRVEVRSAELSGLALNVVRYADGTTNVERLQARLAESEPKQPEGKPEAKEPADLSNVHVDHLALIDCAISFLDKASKGAKPLAVKDIDLTVNDLAAGKPLHVALKAAVLAEQQNFALEVSAAPLPTTLQPSFERVVLKVAPAIDLAPLAPFFPRTLGFEGGTLDADLDARLGAAVPGGSGPTRILGAVHALALRFAGAKSGKPLDVVLDADVQADALKGDVALNKLRLDFGPAGFSGKGRAEGLKSASPRIDGLSITSHDLDPAVLAAYYPPLVKSLGGEVAGPVGIDLHAAGTQAAPRLELKIDLTPVRLALPDTLSKAAGAPLVLTAQVTGAGKGNDEELRFSLNADLAGVDLRPGQSLDKAPGDKLTLSLSGTRKASGTAQHLDIPQLALQLKDDSFDGKLSADLTAQPKRTAFTMTLHSARVDLDKLLLEVPEGRKLAKKEKPPPDPKSFAGLSGSLDVKLDAIVLKKQQLKNAVVAAKIAEDTVTLEQCGVEAFSGSISAAGTTLQLAHPQQPFHALAQLKGLDLEQALAVASPKKVLSGKLDASVDLTGSGTGTAAIKKSLAGNLNGHILDGVFYGKDLIASVTGPLAKSLPFGLAGKTGEGGQTSLGKDLPVSITFANGQAKLGKPLVISTAQAAISLTGGVSLDGVLDLPGVVSLPPATVSALTGGKASVSEPVPIKLRLAGPATSPEVTDLDLGGAVATIAKGAAAGALGKLLGGSGAGDAAGKQGQGTQQQATDAAKKAADQAAQGLKSLFGK